jgi:hypothetical protein
VKKIVTYHRDEKPCAPIGVRSAPNSSGKNGSGDNRSSIRRVSIASSPCCSGTNRCTQSAHSVTAGRPHRCSRSVEPYSIVQNDVILDLDSLCEAFPRCFPQQPGESRDRAKPPASEASTLHQVGEWDRKMGQAAKLEEQLDGESPAEHLGTSLCYDAGIDLFGDCQLKVIQRQA